jgi:hypothetical protein
MQPEKPGWVTAVESRYGDVMINPRGLTAVAGFMNILDGQFGPEKLDKAFQRAREELGLTKRNDEKIQEKRQLLAGGPTHGAPRSNGGGKNGKQVKLPANWREVARKAGIPEADYVREYAAMNPSDVVGG